MSFISGFVFGAAQFVLIYFICRKLVAKDTPGLFLLSVVKLVLWLCFFSLVVIFFRSTIMICGAGAAAALITCGIVAFIVKTRKQKSGKGASETK